MMLRASASLHFAPVTPHSSYPLANITISRNTARTPISSHSTPPQALEENRLIRQFFAVGVLPRQPREKLQFKNLKSDALVGTGQPCALTHGETVVLSCLASDVMVPSGMVSLPSRLHSTCLFSTHRALQRDSQSQTKRLSLLGTKLITTELNPKECQAPIRTDLCFPIVYRNLPSLYYTQFCDIIISSRAS